MLNNSLFACIVLQMKKINVNNLKVDQKLLDFVNEEAIPETNIDIDRLWMGFDKAVHALTPINKKLLDKRKKIQNKINEWHLSNKNENFDESKYFIFLKSIGYIVDEKEDFTIKMGSPSEGIH